MELWRVVWIHGDTGGINSYRSTPPEPSTPLILHTEWSHFGAFKRNAEEVAVQQQVFVRLTAAKLERAGVSIHGKVLQLHGAFGRDGQSSARQYYTELVPLFETLFILFYCLNTLHNIIES